MILVTGAAGFLGRNLVSRLAVGGMPVRGLDLPGRPRPAIPSPIEWHEGDITRRETIAPAFDGVATVVHLAAVIACPDETLNETVNVEGTRTLIQLCRVHGVSRFVFMSAAAAKFRTRNAYGRSKRQAEDLVAASGLNYAIMRTPLIVGAGGEEWDRFVAFVNLLPALVPVLGDGKAIKRPVFVGDAVEALESILGRQSLGNRVWEIAGLDPLTLDDLIDAILVAQGTRKFKLHVPLRLSLALAAMAEMVLGARAPLTRDIVLGLNEHVELDSNGDSDLLNIKPTPISAAIAASLQRTSNGSPQ